MGIMVKDIELVHRVVGTKHVFTSPNVPELYVAHADEEVARNCVQSALDSIAQVKARIAERNEMREIQRERIYA